MLSAPITTKYNKQNNYCILTVFLSSYFWVWVSTCNPQNTGLEQSYAVWHQGEGTGAGKTAASLCSQKEKFHTGWGIPKREGWFRMKNSRKALYRWCAKHLGVPLSDTPGGPQVSMASGHNCDHSEEYWNSVERPLDLPDGNDGVLVPSSWELKTIPS